MTTTYGYDDSDRVTSKSTDFGGGNTFGLTYTRPKARVEGFTTTGGVNSIYHFNSSGQMDYHTQDSKTVNYHYDGNGNPDVVTMPYNTTITNSYNTKNNLTNINVQAANTVIQNFTYTLSPNGNRVAVAEQSGRAVSWVPDTLYRITKVFSDNYNSL